MVVCKNRAEVLKIKRNWKFFQTLPEYSYEWPLVTEKYQKCRKKIILEERWHFVFWGFITVFSRWNSAPQDNGRKKNSFHEQFGNYIKILNQEMFFKGSKAFFPRFLKKWFFYEFSISGKIPPIKTYINFGDKNRPFLQGSINWENNHYQ